MKTHTLYLVVSILLLSCNGQAPIEEENANDGGTLLTELNGKALYDLSCKKCHGEIQKSEKIDATPNEILIGVQDIVRMSSLSELTYQQLVEISKALSSDDPTRIKPQILSGAPAGKFIGATSSLVLKVTTDLPSKCYYDSLDIKIDEMNYGLTASNGNKTHQQTINLSPGASYKYFVHCKDLINDNVTSVSQLISFSTDLDVVDTTPPVISGVYPQSPLLGGTETAKFYFNTNESSTCRFSTDSNATYDQMNNMSTTGTLGHVNIISNLNSGQSYTYYALCADPTGNISSAKGVVNVSVESTVNGALIYANNCKSCHGNLSSSSKRGASSQDINSAIKDFNSMAVETLEFLSPTQIDAISSAL